MDTHFLFNFIWFVCGEQVLCLLTFSLMRILLWGYTPRLRLFGCWLSFIVKTSDRFYEKITGDFVIIICYHMQNDLRSVQLTNCFLRPVFHLSLG